MRRARRQSCSARPGARCCGAWWRCCWCAVRVMCWRRRSRGGPGGAAPAPAAWPDDRARAFAVRLRARVSELLAAAPGSALRGRCSAFVAPELVDGVGADVHEGRWRSDRGPGRVVADVERLDERRALVTVAVAVSSETGMRTRYLAVPVARDAGGGLVVVELPSFAAPPPARDVEPAQLEPLTGAERDGARGRARPVLPRVSGRATRPSWSTWCRRVTRMCGARGRSSCSAWIGRRRER